MIRHWLVRRLTPLVWKLSPERQRTAMREYAIIEKDSGCQILDALRLVGDPEMRAEFFQQALEEFHHADIFESACREVSDAPVGIPIVTRDSLVSPASGSAALLDLAAYVHVGESAVSLDFAAYARAPLHPAIARAFARAQADERHHVANSRRLLDSLGSPARVRWALTKARLLRAWRTYVRVMGAVGQIPLTILLGALYVLSAPLRNISRRRLALPPEAQLEMMREQWLRSEKPR